MLRLLKRKASKSLWILPFSKPRRVQLGSAFRFSTTSRESNDTPISADEFRAYFEACFPKVCIPDKIAVAFSGGPDSTCLLFLLKQMTMSNKYSGLLPTTVLAITIDHGLQSASSQMTARCVELANALQVKHIVQKIPWGTFSFPSHPSQSGSQAFENVAREARYHLLLDALREEETATLAFGHHADDQVETALLRLARGSGVVGAGGMRARRRWGMGFGNGPESVGWAGQHGMARWIVRPLLRIPKVRLEATCRANKLEYVEDPTNFQPDVTDRNRIRHSLKDIGQEGLCDSSRIDTPSLESRTLLAMSAKVNASAKEGNSNLLKEIGISVATLRAATHIMSDYVDNIENIVSERLAECIRPSPASTILLSRSALECVTDNATRLGMVRRILRFVSPLPWGSPRAEAGRRTASLQRIVDTLWDVSEHVPRRRTQKKTRRRLVAGAGVLWTPVSITTDGRLRFSTGTESGAEAWLVSRQPPIRYPAADIEGLSKPDPLEVDITPMFLSAIQRDTDDVVEVLYDCRFLLRIRPRLLPPYVRHALSQGTGSKNCRRHPSPKVFIVPHTRYFLPKIMLRRADSELDSNGACEPRDAELARLLPDGSTHFLMHENNKDAAPPRPARDQDAVRIAWIRTMES